MNLVPLSQLFEVSYGSKFDLKKMSINENSSIAFVGRTAKNNGITAFVDEIEKSPFPAGMITVNLGGAILESYVQLFPFYTAQNVAILKPRGQMSELEKLYYCFAIKANKFRYGAFGREANRTLRTLLVPENVPRKFLNIKINNLSNNSISNKKLSLYNRKWKWFLYSKLFDLYTEPFVSIGEAKKVPGKYPFISTGSDNNGIACMTGVEKAKVYPSGCITVASSGNAGEAFYQEKPFKVTNMITILKPKFSISTFIGLFLVTLIRKEKYRYSYGRKSGIERMKESKIKLPVDKNGDTDWKFMEDYIKSLPYSASI
ncbi:MAG: restriction endonuclease subunit S [Candidatus Azambacteria bacterium]|nr:restriction endonuclease subunit S [Candidatus Azambacteria bacterium]